MLEGGDLRPLNEPLRRFRAGGWRSPPFKPTLTRILGPPGLFNQPLRGFWAFQASLTNPYEDFVLEGGDLRPLNEPLRGFRAGGRRSPPFKPTLTGILGLPSLFNQPLRGFWAFQASLTNPYEENWSSRPLRPPPRSPLSNTLRGFCVCAAPPKPFKQHLTSVLAPNDPFNQPLRGK